MRKYFLKIKPSRSLKFWDAKIANSIFSLKLCAWIKRVLDAQGYSYEIILVDDGSKDNTFREIHKLAEGDPRIKCLSLSRNFGHQNALMAGMEKASGDVIVLMDADLQHPPALLPEKWQRFLRQPKARFQIHCQRFV